MATIEGKVVLFGHELDMSEKHILYVCIAKATLHDRGLLRPYTSDQIRTVIQRMVAWKRPHVIRTKAYMEKLKNSEIIDQLIQELRDPHNLTTRKLADGVEKDLDGYLEKVSQLYEPHKAAIERKVVLFGHELDMHEKQILYVCIAKATLSDGSSKRLYRENEIYIVIQGMVNLKDPGVYNTKAFEEKPKNSRIIRQLTKELRDTRNLTTLRQADRVEKDLNGHLEEVSQLYRLATGPASFRQVGRMENLMINGKLLDHHHLAVLYLASKATLSPSGRPFSMEQIMGMVGIMLRLTGDSGFQKRNVGEYVDVFRNDKDHWVTKVVLDYLQEEKGQQRQEKAPEHVEHLFKQSLRLPLKLFPSNFTAQTKISFPIPGHEAEKEEDTVIESNDDEDDDGKGQVPSVSQGMRSMGLDGPVLPWDMQSSVQGGPSTGRSTYSSNNPALLQRPSPLDKYQDQSPPNNLIYNDPFGSTAYPQQSAYVRPPDQQASPLDTRFAFGRSEGQQRAYSSRNQEPSRLPVQQSAYGPQLAESSVPTNALGDYDPTFFTKSEYSDAQAQGGAWNDKLLPIRDPSKEISSHSGSGRSASPAQAEKQRRAEVEKSRKNKTEESQEKKSGSSRRKKTDDGQEKKSGDSRRKKALKSKDDAKESRRHNRGGTK